MAAYENYFEAFYIDGKYLNNALTQFNPATIILSLFNETILLKQVKTMNSFFIRLKQITTCSLIKIKKVMKAIHFYSLESNQNNARTKFNLATICLDNKYKAIKKKMIWRYKSKIFTN